MFMIYFWCFDYSLQSIPTKCPVTATELFRRIDLVMAAFSEMWPFTPLFFIKWGPLSYTAELADETFLSKISVIILMFYPLFRVGILIHA